MTARKQPEGPTATRSRAKRVASPETSGLVVSTYPPRTTASQILQLGSEVTVAMVRKGFVVAKVDVLSERLHLPKTQTLRVLGLPQQTFNRRKAQGRLNADESDRVVRYAELLARATDLLGSDNAAADWLNTAAPALNGETPIEHATTELGAREVMQLIGRLEHGIPT
jgi:putative toxin-antitoxin system antitoxin component (TIGR02293 family)